MLQTKYITIDEYDEYFPEDSGLRKLLGNEQNALAFLTRVEDRIEVFLDSHFAKKVEYYYPLFTGYQKAQYKKALLEQCYYILHNSEISTDSGADIDRGIIITRETIEKLAISPNSKQYLISCGLWNRRIPQWR